DAAPVSTLAERLAAAVRDDTAAVLASTVLFGSSSVVPNVGAVMEAARRRGAQVLLDAYHGFGVVPFTLSALGAEDAFLVGGGYKYAQWGEGVCFLRVPPAAAALRPVYTGWFVAFGHIAAPRSAGEVRYGQDGATRFAGSTYDPASHYRARRVIRFFEEQTLTVEKLAAGYRRQTGRLLAALDGYEVRTPGEPSARGGFVAVAVANAEETVQRLRERARGGHQ
ncbi:MAG: kynureninase, partial [Myxococcales bacterium]